MKHHSVTSCVSIDESSSEQVAFDTLSPQTQSSLYQPKMILSGPQLVTNPSRLKEIYNLRVDVWEHSGTSQFVNRRLYPDGWSDELDKTAWHWMIVNAEDKIIAAARMNLFTSFNQFPYYPSMKHIAFPHIFPFAFYSRLVIHPDYHGNGLSRQLVSSRLLFCEINKINWGQAFINNKHIIGLFQKLDFKNAGQAMVSYHQSSEPHSVNVLIKNYNYE